MLPLKMIHHLCASHTFRHIKRTSFIYKWHHILTFFCMCFSSFFRHLKWCPFASFILISVTKAYKSVCPMIPSITSHISAVTSVSYNSLCHSDFSNLKNEDEITYKLAHNGVQRKSQLHQQIAREHTTTQELKSNTHLVN